MTEHVTPLHSESANVRCVETRLDADVPNVSASSRGRRRPHTFPHRIARFLLGEKSVWLVSEPILPVGIMEYIKVQPRRRSIDALQATRTHGLEGI